MNVHWTPNVCSTIHTMCYKILIVKLCSPLSIYEGLSNVYFVRNLLSWLHSQINEQNFSVLFFSFNFEIVCIRMMEWKHLNSIDYFYWFDARFTKRMHDYWSIRLHCTKHSFHSTNKIQMFGIQSEDSTYLISISISKC